MLYDLDVHRHVRICLHESENEFLPNYRILLLLQMRFDNPNDSICLVYDSALFSETSRDNLVNDLHEFCAKYSFDAFDVRKDLAAQSFTVEEKKLFDIYEHEIASLGDGGSLNRATNFLRLFNTILMRGIISSESSHIVTRDLPRSIQVQSPCLYNIDAPKIPLDINKRMVQVDTNLLALINIEDAASQLTMLRQAVIDGNVRKVMYNYYGARNVFMAHYMKVRDAFEKASGHRVANQQLQLFPELALLHQVASDPNITTPIDAKRVIADAPNNLEEYAKGLISERFPKSEIDNFSREKLFDFAVLEIIEFGGRTMLPPNYELLGPERAIQYFLNLHLEATYDLIDGYASGGSLSTLALYPDLFSDENLDELTIMSSSFSRYALDRDFIADYYKYNNGRKVCIAPAPNNTTYLDELNASRIDLNKMSSGAIVERTLATIFDCKNPAKEYDFDPHRHVKIWLSNDKNIFMNLENKLRLIKFRETNPGDSITLVVDSKLLSEEAFLACKEFCNQYSITPLDIQDYQHESCATNLEGSLLRIYHIEIDELGYGGNLGAASDILRWLAFVYTKGTYSDMDIDIDTHDMPKTIMVRAPILLNFNPKLAEDNTGRTLVDFNSLSNDLVAIVDSETAFLQISQMQAEICAAYDDPMYSGGLGSAVFSPKIDAMLDQLKILLRKSSGTLNLSIPEYRNFISKAPELQENALDLIRVITNLSSGPIRKGIFAKEKYSVYEFYDQLQWYSVQKYADFNKALNVKNDLSWTAVGAFTAKFREEIILQMAPNIADDISKLETLPPGIAEFLLIEAEDLVGELIKLIEMLQQEINVLQNKPKETLLSSSSLFSSKRVSPQYLPVIEAILQDFNSVNFDPIGWNEKLQAIEFSDVKTGQDILQKAAAICLKLQQGQEKYADSEPTTNSSRYK